MPLDYPAAFFYRCLLAEDPAPSLTTGRSEQHRTKLHEVQAFVARWRDSFHRVAGLTDRWHHGWHLSGKKTLWNDSTISVKDIVRQRKRLSVGALPSREQDGYYVIGEGTGESEGGGGRRRPDLDQIKDEQVSGF